jgi:hypothetical protein
MLSSSSKPKAEEVLGVKPSRWLVEVPRRGKRTLRRREPRSPRAGSLLAGSPGHCVHRGGARGGKDAARLPRLTQNDWRNLGAAGGPPRHGMGLGVVNPPGRPSRRLHKSFVIGSGFPLHSDGRSGSSSVKNTGANRSGSPYPTQSCRRGPRPNARSSGIDRE